ncbi:hypothetical protein BBP12_11115 [Limosilactobacillus reuteri]|nr:hypothetical protein BBP12_11115 [Limosilactobacillus reuteri]
MFNTPLKRKKGGENVLDWLGREIFFLFIFFIKKKNFLLFIIFFYIFLNFFFIRIMTFVYLVLLF